MRVSGLVSSILSLICKIYMSMLFLQPTVVSLRMASYKIQILFYEINQVEMTITGYVIYRL